MSFFSEYKNYTLTDFLLVKQLKNELDEFHSEVQLTNENSELLKITSEKILYQYNLSLKYLNKYDIIANAQSLNGQIKKLFQGKFNSQYLKSYSKKFDTNHTLANEVIYNTLDELDNINDCCAVAKIINDGNIGLQQVKTLKNKYNI